MKAALLLLPALLAFSTFQPSPTSQVECEPGYWFREQITLEQVPLPQGILLRPLEADETSRPGIALENHTNQPLLVLSLQYQEQLVEPTTPDPNYAARLRYAHEVASYLLPPEAARSIMLDMPALLDLDSSLQERNRLDASRPAVEDVAIPAAQHSLLLMVFGEQVLRVPFTISYTLNPDYPTGVCGEPVTATTNPAGRSTPSSAEKAARDSQRGLPGLALVVLVAAVLLGTNLISKLKRNSKSDRG